MTSSSLFWRSKKIAERMLEIENEVKEFHNYSGEIIKICSDLVQKMKDVGDVEVFLEEYAITYRYLSSCAASFSEFNCKMEILRRGTRLTPPFLQITFPPKAHDDNNTNVIDEEKGVSSLVQSPVSIGSVNNTAFPNWNRSEKTESENVCFAPELVKELNSCETDGNTTELDVNKEELTQRAITRCPNECIQRGQHVKSQKPRNEGNEVAEDEGNEERNSLGKEISCADSSEKINKSADPPKMQRPSDPASGVPAAVSANGGRYASINHSESPLQCGDVNLEIGGSRNGEQKGFTDEENKKLKRESAKMEEKREIDFEELKMDRELGVLHHVILSHLVSPDEFYVFVKCKELTLLGELKEKLDKTAVEVEGNESMYKKPSLSPVAMKGLAKKVLGSRALGFCEDLSGWNRIKILDWRTEEKDDLILVFYVDHGASGLLSIQRTKPMDGTVAKYPAFVQKCYLPFIAPAGGEWSEEDKTMFEIFTESTEKKFHLKMEITEKDEARGDGAIGVKLFLPESGTCINEKLVEHGVAVAKKCETRSQETEEMLGRYIRAYAVGDTIPIKVTCIARVNHIFCVKDYEKAGEEDVLQHLIADLNNPESESGMSSLETTPRMGELVIGKYEDGLWYRAQVVKSNPDSSTCRVIFLDYGNTETLSIKEMRKMESKYLEIPFQMLECLLEDIELEWKADQQKAVNYLNEKSTEDTTIKIRKVVKGWRSLYSVSLFDKHGQDIGSQLISAGYALSTANTA